VTTLAPSSAAFSAIHARASAWTIRRLGTRSVYAFGYDGVVLPAIELLFVDDHVVVANKPSGLLVHRGWDDDDDVALFRVRDAIGERVHPVHRLDRGTSGALLFARTRDAARALASAFEHQTIAKKYLALVRGVPPEQGTIDHPIPRSEDGPRVPALTRFERVARSSVDRCSLVLARPETGRLHQIRRHLRHLSHPLVGDVAYGSGAINRHYRATYDLHRLALHAESIAFDHPATGARVTVAAPVPDDLGRALERLGLPRSSGARAGDGAAPS
jgi:tRNA pseudouridine65 synthase